MTLRHGKEYDSDTPPNQKQLQQLSNAHDTLGGPSVTPGPKAHQVLGMP
jgi:hypothetical protein